MTKAEREEKVNLIEHIIYLYDRLRSEQENALELLPSTRRFRRYHKLDWFVDEEEIRLRNNVKVVNKNKKQYEKELADMAKGKK